MVGRIKEASPVSWRGWTLRLHRHVRDQEVCRTWRRRGYCDLRFVWMLIALGVTGLFSVILSARGLWSLPWRRPR